MKIKSLMSTNVVTVKLDDPISKVKEIFEALGFHHLLVVEDKKLFGIISDRDLLKAISPKVDTAAATTQDLATLNKRAHQIMTSKPLCLKEESSVREAINLFNENKISCIPVVNENNNPVGIVSWRDIMRVLSNKAGEN
ncbi:MAG: CBS domain-containing protein [Colwellia sp.]|uniref:CBS domain-containing protein n=1 Tax=Colwellia sp. TaxID=56799 RepID=UPI0025C5BB0E|nr:CBS domain-containing protein [Colwellia sp.]NQZ28689.1 CBS domain-containing protein [Colwellia sp.]